jgi:hypothetical protein
LAAEVSESMIDLAQVHLLIDFDTPFVMPFGIDGALIFFSGLRVLLRSRIARPPAIPASATLAATSGVFAFEATRETVPPALLAAPRPLVAALRPVDFARDFALGLLERFRAWLPWPVDFAWDFALELLERFRFAWLPFELPRRDLEEALVLDEALRLELRLLLERVPDDFVLWAISLPLFRFLAAVLWSIAAVRAWIVLPDGAFA